MPSKSTLASLPSLLPSLPVSIPYNLLNTYLAVFTMPCPGVIISQPQCQKRLLSAILPGSTLRSAYMSCMLRVSLMEMTRDLELLSATHKKET